MKAAHEIKIKELNESQRGHLAWRLDHKTYCGYISAIRIARGEYFFGDKKSSEMTLLQIFMLMDLSEHSAKIHSRKVIDFKSKKGKTRCKK